MSHRSSDKHQMHTSDQTRMLLCEDPAQLDRVQKCRSVYGARNARERSPPAARTHQGHVIVTWVYRDEANPMVIYDAYHATPNTKVPLGM
jgi:hypothetical protein